MMQHRMVSAWGLALGLEWATTTIVLDFFFLALVYKEHMAKLFGEAASLL
jgi:hypothetical protein